eukprot:CAMPEP_0182423790 /NCGR_PEP_ID=MMETSP1167-20130531/9868_1 /TAXON_ID=2988 /ORGANISM="Mallomonas Sp, Strain CCMP3275" /LENGTH=246 /DNA_ID=CAMNT_0024603065 /DNA_START=964 /DNA_END=1704 /DNA_ORIENTATION=-
MTNTGPYPNTQIYTETPTYLQTASPSNYYPSQPLIQSSNSPQLTGTSIYTSDYSRNTINNAPVPYQMYSHSNAQPVSQSSYDSSSPIYHEQSPSQISFSTQVGGDPTTQSTLPLHPQVTGYHQSPLLPHISPSQSSYPYETQSIVPAETQYISNSNSQSLSSSLSPIITSNHTSSHELSSCSVQAYPTSSMTCNSTSSTPSPISNTITSISSTLSNDIQTANNIESSNLLTNQDEGNDSKIITNNC